MTDEPVEVSIEHELIPAPSKTRRAIPTPIQICTIGNNSTFLRWNTFPCSTAVYLLLFELCHSAPARSCPIFQRRFLW